LASSFPLAQMELAEKLGGRRCLALEASGPLTQMIPFLPFLQATLEAAALTCLADLAAVESLAEVGSLAEAVLHRCPACLMHPAEVASLATSAVPLAAAAERRMPKVELPAAAAAYPAHPAEVVRLAAVALRPCLLQAL